MRRKISNRIFGTIWCCSFDWNIIRSCVNFVTKHWDSIEFWPWIAGRRAHSLHVPLHSDFRHLLLLDFSNVFYFENKLIEIRELIIWTRLKFDKKRAHRLVETEIGLNASGDENVQSARMASRTVSTDMTTCSNSAGVRVMRLVSCCILRLSICCQFCSENTSWLCWFWNKKSCLSDFKFETFLNVLPIMVES